MAEQQISISGMAHVFFYKKYVRFVVMIPQRELSDMELIDLYGNIVEIQVKNSGHGPKIWSEYLEEISVSRDKEKHKNMPRAYEDTEGNISLENCVPLAVNH